MTGTLHTLSPLTQLQVLYLPLQKAVTGDLADFRGLTSLRVLVLEKTAVMGDLADIRGLTSLVRLDLEGTAVTGDINADLVGMTQLNTLKLRGSMVHGDSTALSVAIPGLAQWGRWLSYQCCLMGLVGRWGRLRPRSLLLVVAKRSQPSRRQNQSPATASSAPRAPAPKPLPPARRRDRSSPAAAAL